MAEHVPGTPYRYRHGWIPRYPEIHKSDLSTPDARRSRAVTSAEFQRIAATGAAQYQKLKRATSPTIFSTNAAKRGEIGNRAFMETRAPWGGATIDAHTGEFLTGKEDKYALTAREPGMKSVTVAPNATAAEFRAAYEKALSRFDKILQRKDHYLGVFHDADKNEIEIDPVLVTGDKSQTETIGAYTRAVGGAYHFKSGNGFWPPHIRDEITKVA